MTGRGNGIFGTDLDLAALDPTTMLRLGAWTSEQLRLAEQHGAVKAIIATLRQVAGWSSDDPIHDQLLDLADHLENGDWRDTTDLGGLCCPMCQEITCDGGCPLEHIRTQPGATAP